MISTVCFIDTTFKNFEKARCFHFVVQPMGSTVRIAANIIIDGMASQNALQIQLIGHLTLLPGTGVRHCSGKAENHQGMNL